MSNKNQKGIAVLFIPLLVIMLGFIIAAPFFVFSIVKSLSVSNVYQYLFSGDAAGVSYANGAPIINPNIKVTQCTALPIDPNKITTYNSSPHGNSVFSPSPNPGHGTLERKNGVGDAVDLYAPTGTPIYSPFSGTCTLLNKSTKIENARIISNDKKMIVRLVHIDGQNCSDQVQAAQQIGILRQLNNGSHLHFELWINGSPIASKSPGKPLWDLMQKILTQQTCK